MGEQTKSDASHSELLWNVTHSRQQAHSLAKHQRPPFLPLLLCELSHSRKLYSTGVNLYPMLLLAYLIHVGESTYVRIEGDELIQHFWKIWKEKTRLFGYEYLTLVTMRSTILREVTSCSSVFNRRYGGTYFLHLHGGRISQLSYHKELQDYTMLLSEDCRCSSHQICAFMVYTVTIHPTHLFMDIRV
jgi:hypothetical protein